jgi:signal transduction histidine kinase
MSFVRTKLASLSSNGLCVAAYFLLFWFSCGAILCFHTLILKTHIKEQRMEILSVSLSNYLSLQDNAHGSRYRFNTSPPPGIDFIHLNYGHEQVLITGEKTAQLGGFIDIDPQAAGIWIDIEAPDKPGKWLLIRKELADGSIIQAGYNDQTAGIAIYKEATTLATFIFLLAAIPSLGLALLTRNLMGRPLRHLHTQMAQASQDYTTLPLPRAPNYERELIPIHNLLSQILSQNRQLITEMQSSLDNVAHDLRTPMTRLRAVAEYALQSEKNDPSLYRNALSDCLEESERVLSMLKTMMSVAEAEAGTLRLDLQETNVKETLDDIVSLYQYVAEEAQITVTCHTHVPDIRVMADQTRISQVWANLLDNGIKYGHPSGTVDITIEYTSDLALIRFCDDGMGISETEINRIWDRLYRGDRSRSKQGLGLGLNYVKAVITAHGGEIDVSSDIQGGSCFEVRLPCLPLEEKR